MRILVFSWRDPKHPLAGGAEQSMHQHMIGWAKAGHSVTLFSSKINNLKNEEIIDNIKIVRDGNQYLGVQIKGFLYYLKNRKNFDFVVDQFHGIPFFTPFYVCKPKLAVLQEVARGVWFLNLLKFPLNLIVGFLGYISEPLIYFFYRHTAFMVGSNSAKNDLSRYGVTKKNITVVPHGVIIPKKGYSGEEKIAITFLGILAKDKGVEDAINAFKILDGRNDIEFWLIGKAETEQYLLKLKNIVRNLKFKNKIVFWGRVDDNKKFELLLKSLVLLNPSVHEGWGLVNIEANHFGVPVVSYNSAGLVDSVKDGVSGIICKQNSPQELAKNVNYLLDNKGLYKKYQVGAVKWSQKFSWNKSKKLSLQLIKND